MTPSPARTGFRARERPARVEERDLGRQAFREEGRRDALEEAVVRPAGPSRVSASRRDGFLATGRTPSPVPSGTRSSPTIADDLLDEVDLAREVGAERRRRSPEHARLASARPRIRARRRISCARRAETPFP